MKLIIIHPGIQHSYRLANAAVVSGVFEEVHLHSSILYHPHEKPWFKSFQKRVKPIHPEVYLHRHLIYESLARVSRKIYNKIIVNPNKQVHNNPIYFWQFIFGCICLPFVWRHRKNSLLVCFETAGWPLSYFAKKWGIPVIMDFASISHETADSLGIHETNLGKALKVRERQHIDFAFFCSDFCRKSFEGRTSSRKDFVLYLGAEASTPLSLTGSEKSEVRGPKSEVGNEQSVNKESEVRGPKSEVEGTNEKAEGASTPLSLTLASTPHLPDGQANSLTRSEKSEVRSPRSEVDNVDLGLNRRLKISFIANLEYRKGLDILLEALYAYTYPVFLEVHLIGQIRPSWVQAHLPQTLINQRVQLVYQEAMSQTALFNYLAKEAFDVNVQPSRFDSFAMVVPETMMLGIPNLVSPYVGAGEMLDHGLNGWIMEKLDAAHLSTNLKQLMALNIEERSALKAAVLKKAAEMTWENYDEAVAEAMREILIEVRSKR